MNLRLKILLIIKLSAVVVLSTYTMTRSLNCISNKAIKVEKLDVDKLAINPLLSWNQNYERTIEFIKQHEGFANGKPYICPGGHKTIGYGHVIRKNENFTSLTEEQADSLLRDDFNKALKLVERTTDIGGSRKLAIAHFVFARGIGTFLNSPLKTMVMNNRKIDDEIIKWSYYRSASGKKIQSSYAMNIRKWEIKMYNNKF